MTTKSRKQIEAFLSDLTELSRKHGITIDGCGCCGSPFLDDWTLPLDPSGGYYLNDIEECLRWVQPGVYEWDADGRRPGMAQDETP